LNYIHMQTFHTLLASLLALSFECMQPYHTLAMIHQSVNAQRKPSLNTAAGQLKSPSASWAKILNLFLLDNNTRTII